jgi:GT2 family glycosyltransferase
MAEVTFIYPIIRLDFITKSLESLYRFTDHSKFKVIIVDQSIEGYKGHLADMVIRQKNQGFSNAANQGIIHALRWETPYIAVVNDDTEMMYNGWWEDLLQEFETDPKIVAVCPESPRVAGWGYGLDHNACIEIVPYKDEFTKEDIAYLKQGDYDCEEMQSRHPDFKIPESFPMTKRGVVDGVACWMPVFKREGLIELGLFDERFVWGGGEDYDMNTRAYSCAWPIPRDICNPDYHRRMVSTMKSWVWHHWGKSKDLKQELDPKLFEGLEPWNSNTDLWGEEFDVWGHRHEGDKQIPLKRDPEVFVRK